MPDQQTPRRKFLKTAVSTGLGTVGGGAMAQSFTYQMNQRYPEPAVMVSVLPAPDSSESSTTRPLAERNLVWAIRNNARHLARDMFSRAIHLPV